MYVGTDYSQQDGFISHPYLILYRHCFADAYQIGRLPSADLQTTQYPRVQLPAHLQECRDEVWVVHSLCKEPGNREVHSCFTNCNQTVQQCLPRQVPHSKYSPIHHFVTECEMLKSYDNVRGTHVNCYGCFLKICPFLKGLHKLGRVAAHSLVC